MLTPEQIAAFTDRGFVRIRGAFPRDEANALEARVWRWLAKKRGVSEREPDRWPTGQAWGLQGLRSLGANVIGSETTYGAIDGLLGAGRWKQPRDWGSFLLTFPSPGAWRVPHRVWHTDFDYVGSLERPIGALVFSFVSDVPPGGGGTTVVEGSPRVVARFLAKRPRASFKKMRNLRVALFASEPWLVQLGTADEDPERNDRLMREGAVIGSHPVRVVELAAEAGDLVIGHPWLLHAGAPNCGARPRMMCVQRIALVPPS